MVRKTKRPIRPKPLIPTRVAMDSPPGTTTHALQKQGPSKSCAILRAAHPSDPSFSEPLRVSIWGCYDFRQEGNILPMSNAAVLVLNQNYEPLNVCNARRAFILVDRGKAEIIEHGEGGLRSAFQTFPLPSVIRLIYMIRRPRPKMRLTRREIFVRDHYTCQYCGRQTKDLTIDHVLPRHRGGPHT